MVSYILWDQSAELFSWHQFSFRWNGLLLLLAFIIGRQILVYIFRREGSHAKDVDVLITLLILGAFLGARIGHVIFYQPELWSKPLTVFFPFEFKPAFHFTGITGFSSHGGVLGILLGVWVYILRKKGGHFLQVLDRVSILAVWIGIPILVGSFLNSEIEGKPTSSALGTVFIQPVANGLLQLPCCIMRNPGGKNPIRQVVPTKGKDIATRENGHHSIVLYFFFNQGTPVETVDEFMLGDVKAYLFDNSKIVEEPGTQPLHYAVFKEPNGDFDVRVRTIGVARYPVQLFESFSCLLLFLYLFWYWTRHKAAVPEGRIFGVGMIVFWTLRFAYEFMKEDQVPFIKGTGLNKAQILCIPLLLLGIAILIKSFRKTEALKGK